MVLTVAGLCSSVSKEDLRNCYNKSFQAPGEGITPMFSAAAMRAPLCDLQIDRDFLFDLALVASNLGFPVIFGFIDLLSRASAGGRWP
jgi:hypothetical protein